MTMNEQDESQQNNMISNLPLLFANGYPTSLDKISATQLEKFIPFMVQCSLGHINIQCNLACSEPEWWPEDIPFSIPFSKPRKFNGNWMEKMKEVVIICYQFHKSVFLLRFCSDLASYEHASLRFINNYNSTTSLFDRRSNKLLVTFRNENMSYDQSFKSRKCLLQHKSKLGYWSQACAQQQIMVESAPFDIYLCDYCDAELYSKEAILEHEKTCNNDDDVILCDSDDDFDNDTQINAMNEEHELRKRFLSNFNLHFSNDKINYIFQDKKSISYQQDLCTQAINSIIRIPKRKRTPHSLGRYPTIPISSPAGLNLVRSAKTLVGQEYLTERFERMERFCNTPILAKNQVKPRFFEKKGLAEPLCTFKQPSEFNSHVYTFPRRQYSKKRSSNYTFLNSILIKRCKPISIRLKKINSFHGRKSTLKNNLNIKLTRDVTESTNWNILQSTSAGDIFLETIDLCSSEDEEIITKLSIFERDILLEKLREEKSIIEHIQEKDSLCLLNMSPSENPSEIKNLYLKTIDTNAEASLLSNTAISIGNKSKKSQTISHAENHTASKILNDIGDTFNKHGHKIYCNKSVSNSDQNKNHKFTADNIYPDYFRNDYESSADLLPIKILPSNLSTTKTNLIISPSNSSVKNLKQNNSLRMTILEEYSFSKNNIKSKSNLQSYQLISEIPSIASTVFKTTKPRAPKLSTFCTTTLSTKHQNLNCKIDPVVSHTTSKSQLRFSDSMKDSFVIEQRSSDKLSLVKNVPPKGCLVSIDLTS